MTMNNDRGPNNADGGRAAPKIKLQPGRVIAAAAAIGLILLVLWQAGVVFDSNEAGVTANGQQVTLRPSDTAIVTPNPAGIEVGLRSGQLAPDFEFSAFDGRRLKLSDYRGRAVILNFWASWCGPCRAEMPDMEAILHRFADQGLIIVGVNNGEGLKPAARFLDNLGVEFSAFAFDPNQDIAQRFSIRGMPTSYFIDSEGLITQVVLGQLSPAILEANVLDAIGGYAAIPNP